VGCGVQLGPLGTAATNRPTVPTPGDYDDGEIGGLMIGKGNRSTQRKSAPVPLCPSQTPHACPDTNPGRRGGKPATNRLSYGTTLVFSVTSWPALGPTQPSVRWVPEALSRRIKLPGREADLSPPSSAEIKNGETMPPLTHTSSWRGTWLSAGSTLPELIYILLNYLSTTPWRRMGEWIYRSTYSWPRH
jgi:hypothetical protein